METNLAPLRATQQLSVYSNVSNFEDAQRFVKALQAADILPDQYKNNTANCLVALDYAWRLNVSPLTVMDNLHIIKGKRSWSAQFIAGLVNSCGRFAPIRYKIEHHGNKECTYMDYDGSQRVQKKITVPLITCHAYSVDVATGDALVSPTVSTELAVKEGWWTKKDSKWPHMHEAMLMYRAASYFGRMYASDLLMGMHAPDEVEAYEAPTVDVVAEVITDEKPATRKRKNKVEELNEKAKVQPEPKVEQIQSEEYEEAEIDEEEQELE